MEILVSLAKRRGFVFPSAEIYGGLGAVWDYGPLGALMKQNLRTLWLERFIYSRQDVIPIEASILTNRKVLQASGHEKGFSDSLVECRICHERFRSDHEIPQAKDHKHDLTKAKQFNIMFKTYAGPIENEGNLVYLRPETAQGMFTNFKLVADALRLHPPFGIAQIGKNFRNEITTGHFIFRLRELEIAELEYYVLPEDAARWNDVWVKEWQTFFADLGLSGDKVRIRILEADERAHYAASNMDFEYEFPFGWGEFAGVANRTDYDLKNHIEHSGKDLTWFNEEAKEKIIPYVIEPTLGLDRLLMALLVQGLMISDGTDGREAGEMVLKLHPRVAPITVAVFPLVKKEGLAELAGEIAMELRTSRIGYIQTDESGSIGRRYRRQDEIGTPFCVTVDFQTKEDGTVTIRQRDTLKQERVHRTELAVKLKESLA
ncbi:glycine--tRNA ligase [Candidatus Berkelbacteria bacterium]|nr:glycine--tRNA ligase [Candidatus Berkelbacteria bacterium]